MLLRSTITDKAEAADALLLFAARTTVSMALLSSDFGLALASEPSRSQTRAECTGPWDDD